ncbi:unnamed protein product, partial [Laminaria digitata]
DGRRAHQPTWREVKRVQQQQQQQQRHRPRLPADDGDENEKERGSILSGGMWSVLQEMRRPQRRQRQHQQQQQQQKQQKQQQRYTRAYASSAAAASASGSTLASGSIITSASSTTITSDSRSGSTGGSSRSGSRSGSGSGSSRPPRLPSLVTTGVLSLLASTTTGFFAALPGAEAKVVPNGAMVWDGNGWIALVDDPTSPLPPPPKTDSWKRRDTQLFVGVSSFRDKRCPQTLVNYFTKAKYPSRVTVGVVQQNDHEDVDCVTEYCHMMGGHEEGPGCPHFDNIKTLRVEAKHAAGPCYGRHLQAYMLRDEEFCMQTDSHMDVVQDWDDKLMSMWGRVNNEYGILTTYVHKIEQLHEGYENKKEVPHLCQLGFTNPGNHPRYVQAKLATKLTGPKLTNTWAAGLSLAKCHAWKATPYDPGLRKVFDGEEFSMHARLWTRGYDTYTPDKSLVGHDYNKVTDGPPPSRWVGFCLWGG